MVTVFFSCVMLAATGAMRGRSSDTDLSALGMVAPRASMGHFRTPERRD